MTTDLELNRKLALAIGWRGDQIRTYPRTGNVYVDFGNDGRLFDHSDWRVIGPIAQRFDCFPNRAHSAEHIGEWYAPLGDIANGVYADTPQKAIARAVIQGSME